LRNGSCGQEVGYELERVSRKFGLSKIESIDMSSGQYLCKMLKMRMVQIPRLYVKSMDTKVVTARRD
jgi:hypothetical protein